jgi:hypothetical protein
LDRDCCRSRCRLSGWKRRRRTYTACTTYYATRDRRMVWRRNACWSILTEDSRFQDPKFKFELL